ncbi:MAG TPA: beta-ketoacyl synthase chain length factor, partial [Myxococcota bacterium]|nr:beta-ketoacyl synthase chain length factor [Myxococcota bacterium]
GAAWLLLERRPGPFRLVGVGVRTDGIHLTAPDEQGGGVRRAIRAALGELPGEAVDHVNAHATGTEANDGAEARGIFAACPKALVSATKGATGHTLGAAGVVEAVLLLQSMERGLVPGLRGLQAPLPDLDLSAQSRLHPQELGVSVNLAFGGHNAAVAFARSGGGEEDEQTAAPALEVVVRAHAGWGPTGAHFSAEGRAEGEICAVPDPVRPEGVPAGSWRRLSRLARLAAVVTAAMGPPPDPDIALFWGTSCGEYSSTFQFLRSLHAKGPAGASPLAFQNSVHNAPAGHLSILFGLRGHSETLCAGPDTALLLVERAMAWVALHRKAALVIMGDEAGPEVQTGLRLAGVTGTLGEGAVALWLEPAGEGRRLRLVERPGAGAWHRHRAWPGEPRFSAPIGTKAPEGVFGMAPISDLFALLTCLEAGEGQVAWTGGRYSTTLEVR